jgi:hypothetical protein
MHVPVQEEADRRSFITVGGHGPATFLSKKKSESIVLDISHAVYTTLARLG